MLDLAIATVAGIALGLAISKLDLAYRRRRRIDSRINRR